MVTRNTPSSSKLNVLINQLGRAAEGAAAREEKKKQGTTKELVPRTKSKGKEIEVISLEEELEGFHLSGGDGYEIVDEGAGDTSGLEEEEEDSFVDIDGTPGTRRDQEGGIRGTDIVGRSVEVVTRSGRRAGRVVYGK